jgi:hypothetical protein
MRVSRSLGAVFFFLSVAYFLVSCRGVSSINVPPVPTSQIKPVTRRVFLIVFENQKFEGVVGNKNAPYINHLMNTRASADNFYADTHPSLGDYFMQTTGDIISNDLNFAETVTQNNIAREMGQAGVSWRAYLESMPEPGYLGDKAYPYVKSHNPFAYFSDIRMLKPVAQQMVPFSQFQSDLASGELPALIYIAPDQTHNMHDCEDGSRDCDNDAKLATGDQWLHDLVEPILASDAWNKTESLMIIAWDESWDNDFRNGGGHIPVILLGTKVKMGFHSQTFYQHESTLNLMCSQLELPCDMGKAKNAPPMDEFLQP